MGMANINATCNLSIQGVRDNLNKAVSHYIDMVDKFNAWKYGKTPMGIESEKDFEKTLEIIKGEIIKYSQRLKSYEKYAEDNK